MPHEDQWKVQLAAIGMTLCLAIVSGIFILSYLILSEDSIYYLSIILYYKHYIIFKHYFILKYYFIFKYYIILKHYIIFKYYSILKH